MAKPNEQDMTNFFGNIVAQLMIRKGVDVQWRFNVPKNPHAGGGWERAIKSVKCFCGDAA